MHCPTLNQLPPPPPGKSGWPWTEESPQLPGAMPAPSTGLKASGTPWPRISIVTPSYNQGQFIEETIRSVLLQGYPDLEYIIIDGGSMDGTREVIEKYQPWLAYWVSEPDRGQSHAINKGLEKASGDWFAWLNADDIYLKNTFSRTVLTITEASESISWIVGTTIFTDFDLREINRFKPSLYTASGRDSMGWMDFVCTKHSGIALPQPSSFWRRSAVVEVGGIDESLKYAMDHELYGRLAYKGYRPVLLEDALACFRIHQAQKTIKFGIEELKIVDQWMARVDGVEQERLQRYRIWLDRQIKYYPYKFSLRSTIFRFVNVMKPIFKPVSRQIKNLLSPPGSLMPKSYAQIG